MNSIASPSSHLLLPAAKPRVQRAGRPSRLSAWLDSLDSRRLEILDIRILADRPSRTLADLGSTYGVSRERVRQIERWLIRKAREAVPYDEHFARLAEMLGAHCGVAVPAADEALDDIFALAARVLQGERDWGPRERRCARALLRHEVLPKVSWNGWRVIKTSLPKSSRAALLALQQPNGLIRIEDAKATLLKEGVAIQYCREWIDALRMFREVDGGWLHSRKGLGSKAFAYLRYLQRPMSIEELVNWTGATNERSLRNVLYSHPDIIRVNNKPEFVWSGTPGYEKYEGIIEELKKDIRRRGGRPKADKLAASLARRCSVTRQSVISYLKTRHFVHHSNGTVSIRKRLKPGEVAPKRPLDMASRCYRRRNGAWAAALVVNHDLRRGCGRRIPEAFAKLCGCAWGERVALPSNHGEIMLVWHAKSLMGAAVGTLSRVVRRLGAADGDYLFLEYRKGRLDIQHMPITKLHKKSPLQKLALLVGISGVQHSKSLIHDIAYAIGIDQNNGRIDEAAVRKQLRRRFEYDLLDFV